MLNNDRKVNIINSKNKGTCPFHKMKSGENILVHIESMYADDALPNHLFVAKEIKKGQYLLREGQTVNNFLVIKSGLVKCFVTEDNDKDYILAFRGRGETLGELEIIQNEKCGSSVQAVEATLVYSISRAMFQHWIDTDLVFNGLILKGLAGELQNLAKRSAIQQFQSSKHTLETALAFFKKHHLQLTKKDLADYLAITVRTLNRTLKELDENPFVSKDSL